VYNRAAPRSIQREVELTDIIVEVRGGVVVGVYTDVPDARVVLVDWDNIEAGDRAGLYPADHLCEIPDETSAQIARAADCTS